MRWLMTFLVGALVGAGVLFVILREVPDAPAPSPVTAPVAAATPAGPPQPGVPAARIEGQLPGAPAVPTDLAESELPVKPEAGDLSAAKTAGTPGGTPPTGLMVPVQGVKAASLNDTFNQPRGNQRRHEALDIMAPKGTPVLAAGDGKVVKLFESKPGGLTVYQFDPSEKYAYYYAHLDRYAEGLQEGKVLKRGDLVGYVGVTGNSDPNAPHLHFAVVELTPEKEWWKGTPLNPFPLLTTEQAQPAPAR
jgi:murein DD-endopeptidase MepM/ murein hydrolase activator NlpD